MKTLLLCLALFGWQLQSGGPQTVVRLNHPRTIPVNARGEMVELMQSPDVVALPLPVPRPGPDGSAWFVDIRNLGPNDVTIQQFSATPLQNDPQTNGPQTQNGTQTQNDPQTQNPLFSITLHPKDVTRIRAAGSKYVASRRN
jgi:hypothetical protein